MLNQDFIAIWLLLPLLVAVIASGVAFKFGRRRTARARRDGWREARIGPAGRVFGASLVAFAVLLPTMEPLRPGEELGYMLAVINAVFLFAALVIRYFFFFSVAWSDDAIDHRGLWQRRRLSWGDVVGAGYSKGFVCLMDCRRRRYWVPSHLDGYAEFRAFAQHRVGAMPGRVA